MSDFYDLTSPLNNTIKEDKSDLDLETDIPLCDKCSNIILKPLNNLENNSKLICPNCGEIYDPHYEIVQVQDSETTIDELSSQGTLTYHKDAEKEITKQSKTINHKEARLEDNLEYITKEFERYRQVEIIDKDTITGGLNKTRKPNRE
jgi:hypothetical protein